MTCAATRHDTLDAYANHGCRCPAARKQASLRSKEYRLRKLRGQSLFVDACGTRRRLQALWAIGWRSSDIAQHTNGTRIGERMTAQAVTKAGQQDVVHVKTAQAVRQVYDQLWRTPGPSEQNRARSARRGWPTPLELDDDHLDDPDYRPRLHRLTPRIAVRQRRELIRETIAHLTAQGVSARQIAEHVGISQRAVVRHRERLRQAS